MAQSGYEVYLAINSVPPLEYFSKEKGKKESIRINEASRSCQAGSRIKNTTRCNLGGDFFTGGFTTSEAKFPSLSYLHFSVEKCFNKFV